MTGTPDTSANLRIRMDGVPLAKATTKQVTTTPTGKERFWASTPRYMVDGHKEVLEISLGAARLLNHVSFDISHFPLTANVQYLDSKGVWRYITYQRVLSKVKTREPVLTPISTRINTSVPGRVNSAQATSHPQHFGKAHWYAQSWKVTPVTTSKIRFLITRNKNGKPPVDHANRRVAYSVALRNIKFGYQVITKVDIPKTPPVVPGEPPPWWASSRDILGSRTVYSTYTQDAHAAVDGNNRTFWRSEPQPFPFAVVAVYLDLRTDEGEAPVIDRFWLDPVTVGPVCNVYYSSDEPMGDFDGVSEPIPDQYETTIGNPSITISGAANTPLSIDLGPTVKTGVEISNVYQRMHYNQPWWVGIDARSMVGADDTNIRPIVTLGSTQIFQSADGHLVVSDEDGRSARITLDPALHVVNTSFRLVVAYYPADAASGRDPYFRISYLLANAVEPDFNEIAIPALLDSNEPMKVGLSADSDAPDVSAIAIKGLVVKSESLDAETEEWFLAEGSDYVTDPETPVTDRGTAQNARLRMHPDWLSSLGNPFGIVGGAGDRYGDMVWTPVTRDFTLRRGYLHIPPTKAKYWKFEMTRLLPQVYENFVTINREVLVFPPDVVDNYEGLSAGSSDLAPSGVNVAGNIAETLTYRDVLNGVRQSAVSPDSTDVLVVKDIRLAARAAESGWIWTYQPWHVGDTAPQFTGTSVHRYESVMVDHSAKVAYFAGIKEIEPFRVDYTFNDDTPEYVEHMLDLDFIDTDTMSGMGWTEGSLEALSARGEVTSVPLRSYRTVRGVQFATQETDAFQVLANPDFATTLDQWAPYGDADINYVAPSDVQIDRGWFSYTWGDVEDTYPTYGDMEGVLYGALEGNDPDTGYAEGGMTSVAYSPSGAGKVTARAKISTAENMVAPVRLELIAAATGQVVALAEAFPKQGETAILECGYAPGALLDWHTYDDIETTYPTYGDMEGVTYGALETEQLQTALYARVRQLGATRDSFHVHRLGIYDSPIAWFFSNDEGASWWQAIDVANNPQGVLLFPQSTDPDPGPEVGRALMWRARFFTSGANLSALHIRPWYGNRARTVLGAHTMEALGPNQSIYDNFPSTGKHPMWGPRPPSEESAIAVISTPTSSDDDPSYGGGGYGDGPYGD